MYEKVAISINRKSGTGYKVTQCTFFFFPLDSFSSVIFMMMYVCMWKDIAPSYNRRGKRKRFSSDDV